MDYINLLGAEQVSDAGHSIRHAAESMQGTAVSLDDTLFRYMRSIEDVLDRHIVAFTEQVDRLIASKGK